MQTKKDKTHQVRFYGEQHAGLKLLSGLTGEPMSDLASRLLKEPLQIALELSGKGKELPVIKHD